MTIRTLTLENDTVKEYIVVFSDGTLRKSYFNSRNLHEYTELIKRGGVCATLINPETLSVLGSDGKWHEIEYL